MIKLQCPEGKVVRSPEGDLKEGTFEVVQNAYWLRRLKDGSVKLVKEEKAKAIKPEAKKK